MRLKLTPNIAAELRAFVPAAVVAWQAREDRRQAARLTLMNLTDQQQELRLDVAAARGRIATFDPRFHGLAVAREKAHIVPLEAEIARLQGQIDRAREVVSAAVGVCTRCADLFGEHSGGRLRDVPLPPVKRPGGGWPQAVEGQRQALTNRQERFAAVAEARPAGADVVAKVKAHCAALREKGRPDVSYLLRAGGSVADIRWPVASMEYYDAGRRGHVNVPDVPAILAWLPGVGDKLEAAIVAEIEAAAKGLDGEALTDAERERLLAELPDEMLQIERVEEAMIRAAEAEGLEILRRADADARAVLSVEVC